MKKDNRVIIKVVVFGIIFSCMFLFVGKLMQMQWLDWNEYDTTKGFYEEPENTIETIFLGSSVAVSGVNPIQIYDQYGACTYNLGSANQPVYASYYWLKEAHRFHPDTLKTVVFDVSMLRKRPAEEEYYKAMINMKWSEVKMEAVSNYGKDLNEKISFVFPFFRFHSRWEDLGKWDFDKLTYEPNTSTRGYKEKFDVYFASRKERCVMPEYYVDYNAEKYEFEEEALLYFGKMVAFCEEKDIDIILIKTPCPFDKAIQRARLVTWSSGWNIAVNDLAIQYDLEFYDFNYLPLIDEIGYNHALDSMEGIHLNYYGAQKLTNWIGNYLNVNGKITDVRGNDQFEFLEQQNERYKDEIQTIAMLKDCKDPVEYIRIASEKEKYIVFVMVKDDASISLRNEQRLQFKKLGLKKLANLSLWDSYLAIVENGTVYYEELQEVSENDFGGQSILYKGNMEDGKVFIIESAGWNDGNFASCVINGIEYARNERGINIVVYDKEADKVIESIVFDTCMSSERDVFTESQIEKEIRTKSPGEYSESLRKYIAYIDACEASRNRMTEKGVVD